MIKTLVKILVAILTLKFIRNRLNTNLVGDTIQLPDTQPERNYVARLVLATLVIFALCVWWVIKFIAQFLKWIIAIARR
mgnify:CR=1 FL=1